MKTKLLISGLALVALTALSNGQDQGTGKRYQNSGNNTTAYADENKDGVCDNYTANSPRRRQAAGNASFAGCGQGQGNGSCNRGNGNREPGSGKRLNFIDTDKNGICDYLETPEKK